jgi:tripartite-type tricarboxylate transporter receptor subunit TctC
MMFDVVSLALPQIKAGRVRALGVAAKERVRVPEVPTLTEQGFPAEVGGWFGVLAPAGTPPEAIAWINRETTKVFSRPTPATALCSKALRRLYRSPETFGKFIAAESARYGDIIQRAGIKLE